MKKYITPQEYEKATGIPYDLEGERIYLVGEQTYKTTKMNNLFHGLLSCYWLSNCHRFDDYEDMRSYYKGIAGLVIQKNRTNNLSSYTKKCLYKAIKILPLDENEKMKVYSLLRGEYTLEKSWADATKKQAQTAIDAIINDMNLNGVIESNMGKKYEEILKGIGNWYDF